MNEFFIYLFTPKLGIQSQRKCKIKYSSLFSWDSNSKEFLSPYSPGFPQRSSTGSMLSGVGGGVKLNPAWDRNRQAWKAPSHCGWAAAEFHIAVRKLVNYSPTPLYKSLPTSWALTLPNSKGQLGSYYPAAQLASETLARSAFVHFNMGPLLLQATSKPLHDCPLLKWSFSTCPDLAFFLTTSLLCNPCPVFLHFPSVDQRH